MDGWIKLPQKERHYYLLIECSVSTQKNRVRGLQAADVRINLDCWLGVTIKDISAAWVKW